MAESWQARCSNPAPLSQLHYTLLKEFPSRDVCCFSALVKIVTSLLHSATPEIPAEM